MTEQYKVEKIKNGGQWWFVARVPAGKLQKYDTLLTKVYGGGLMVSYDDLAWDIWKVGERILVRKVEIDENENVRIKARESWWIFSSTYRFVSTDMVWIEVSSEVEYIER